MEILNGNACWCFGAIFPTTALAMKRKQHSVAQIVAMLNEEAVRGREVEPDPRAEAASEPEYPAQEVGR